MATDLGRRILRARQLRHLTQAGLGELVGVSARAVRSWERDGKVPRNLYVLEAALAPYFTVNGTPPPPADPRERELWDLAIQDMPPAQAWEVIEEYRLRKRSRTA